MLQTLKAIKNKKRKEGKKRKERRRERERDTKNIPPYARAATLGQENGPPW